MNITPLPGIPLSALALSVAVTSQAVTQQVEEAPSTVNATYVADSATDALEPGEKIENLYNKNVTQDYLSGGHGNVGSHDDVEFYLTFLDDLEAAVGEAFGNVSRGAGIENPEAINTHAAFFSSWITALGRYATDVLRPTYGDYYGFEYTTPRNAEMVAWVMYAYR